jgi:hypothetical protein
MRKLGFIAVVTVLFLLSQPLHVYADYVEGEKTGTGTVIVGNVAPSVTSMGLYEEGGSSNLTAMDPDVQYEVRVTVSDNNLVQDATNVTVTLVASGGTQFLFDETASYGFQFDNSSGTPVWRELTGSGWSTSYTYLNATASTAPTGTTEGTCVFVLHLYKTAHRETTWTMNGSARDVGGLSGSKANQFGVNSYVSFTIPSAVSWGTLEPGATNATAGSMPANIQVTSNYEVAIQIRGSGDLTNGDGGSIPLANVYVGQTSDPGNNDGIALGQTYKDMYTSITSADGTSYPTYWYISVPAQTQAGTYSFTYYIRVQ